MNLDDFFTKIENVFTSIIDGVLTTPHVSTTIGNETEQCISVDDEVGSDVKERVFQRKKPFVVTSFVDVLNRLDDLVQNACVDIWSSSPPSCTLDTTREYCITVSLPGAQPAFTFVMVCATAREVFYIASSPILQDANIAFNCPHKVLWEVPGTYFRKIRVPRITLESVKFKLKHGVLTISAATEKTHTDNNNTTYEEIEGRDGRKFIPLFPSSFIPHTSSEESLIII